MDLFRNKFKQKETKERMWFEKLKESMNTAQDEIQKRKEKLSHLLKNFESEKRQMEAKTVSLKQQKQDLESSLLSRTCIYDEEKIDEMRSRAKEHQKERLLQLYREMVKKIIQVKFREYLISLLEVSQDNSVPPSHDCWDTKEEYKIYGLLLSACNVRTMEYIGKKQQLNDGMTEGSTEAVHQEEKEASLSLTFKMLKLLPPLVICRPKTYNENVSDTNWLAWDEEQSENAPLHYYRPVLVYGNHLYIAVKGLVGNKKMKPECKSSNGITAPLNNERKQRHDKETQTIRQVEEVSIQTEVEIQAKVDQ